MIVFVSDTHFGAKANNKDLFERKMQFFEKQFFPYILQHKENIEAVIHCGDLMHNRKWVDNFILQSVKSRFTDFFEREKINLYLLMGNHDTYFKNSREYNSLDFNFREYNYITIINKPITTTIGKYKIGFSPWIIEKREFRNIPKNVDVLVGHFEIKEFLFENPNQFQTKDGIQTILDYFKEYKIVMSGHFHNTCRRENIMYVGAPYQMDWGDFNRKKGFYILKDDFNIEFVENETSPKFIRICYYEEGGVVQYRIKGIEKYKDRYIKSCDVSQIAANNYCNLIVKSTSKQQILEDNYRLLSLKSKDGYQIETIDENAIFTTESLETESLDEKDIPGFMKSFIDVSTFDPSIDKQILFNMMVGIHEQANTIREE